MFVVTVILLAASLFLGVYLFRRADYSCWRNNAYDRWIFLHGDALWRHISLLGKLACVALLVAVAGAFCHDVVKAKGEGPIILFIVAASLLGLILLISAIAAFLHHCYVVQDRLPTRKLLLFGLLAGVLAGILAALNLPEIPDGSTAMLVKKSLSFDLTDELLARVMAYLHVRDPRFYLHAVQATPIVTCVGGAFAVWMVTAVSTHRLWRAASDPLRARLFPFAALAFGACVFLVSVFFGVFLAGYALRVILGVLTFISGMFMLFVVLPWFAKSSFEILNNNANSSSSDFNSSDYKPKHYFTGSDGQEYIGDHDDPSFIRPVGSGSGGNLRRNSNGDFEDPSSGKTVSLNGRSRL